MVDFLPLSGVFKGVLFGVLLSLCFAATDVGVFNGVLRVLLFFLGVFHPNPNNSAPLLTTSSSSLSPSVYTVQVATKE